MTIPNTKQDSTSHNNISNIHQTDITENTTSTLEPNSQEQTNITQKTPSPTLISNNTSKKTKKEILNESIMQANTHEVKIDLSEKVDVEPSTEISNYLEKLGNNTGHSKWPLGGSKGYYPNFTQSLPGNHTEMHHPHSKMDIVTLYRELNKLRLDKVLVQIPTEEFEKDGNVRKILMPHNVVHQATKDRVVTAPVQTNKFINANGIAVPNTQELTRHFYGNKVFSTLDLKSAFHLIPFKTLSDFRKDNPDKEFVVFTAMLDGKEYMYTSMVFGLSDAATYFQLMMYDTLRGIGSELGDEKYDVGNGKITVYIDDILISTVDVEENERILLAVMKRLDKQNFCIKREKCNLFYKRLKFLGVIIDENGCRPDPNKLTAIRNLPTPTTVKSLESFIGSVAFHSRFTKDFSNLMLPLQEIKNKHKRTGRNLPLSTETKCLLEHLVKTVKNKLADCIALSHFNPNLPLRLYTDASNIGLAGALVNVDNDGNTFIVDVWSRSLDHAQKRLPIFKKELLAIRFALHRWRRFLMYQDFTIAIDNNSLVKHLIGQVQANGVLEERIVDEVNEYSPNYMFINSENNPLADILSRAPNYLDIPSKFIGKLMSLRRNKKINDDLYVSIIPSKEEQNRLLTEAHSFIHDAPAVMVDRIRSSGKRWPNMADDAKAYCANCLTCNEYNPKSKIYHAPQQIIATAPMHHVQMDLAGPFPVSNNNNCYALIYTCIYTGYTIIKPIPNKQATTLALAVSTIWCDYSPPVIIQSDNGTEFKNELLQDMIEQVKTTLRYSAEYNPRTNGRVETKVGQFKLILEKLVSKGNKNAKKKNWDLFAPLIQLAINSRTSSVTKYSPFFLMFNREPRGIIEGNYTSVPMAKFNISLWLKDWEYHYGKILDEVMSNRNAAWENSSKRWLLSRIIQEDNIPIGSRVMVAVRDKISFSPRRVGPYFVVGMDNFRNYKLSKTNHADNTKNIILRRKFARDMLYMITPESSIGLILEPIVAISKRIVSDPLDSTDLLNQYYVRYGDTEVEDSWVTESLIPDKIIEDYMKFEESQQSGVYQVPKELLMNCYSLNSEYANQIILDANLTDIPLISPTDI